MESNSVCNHTSDKLRSRDLFNHEYDYRSKWTTQVLLPINLNHNKICDILDFFKIKTQEIPDFFLLAMKEKKPFKRAHDGAHCPINYTVLLALKSG